MRIAITGATGNVGTSLLRALEGESSVESIIGIARRRPGIVLPKTTWVAADVAHDDLLSCFREVDAVVHLAWLIQPERDVALLERTNVAGSRRVFEAAVTAGVDALVYASSVGAYSPAPKDRLVDETWPTEGIASSLYSRQKAAVERILDAVESGNPRLRVVRTRATFILKHEAAAEQRRLFLGRLFPRHLARPGWIPFVPSHPRLRFQAVHSLDVGEAYRLALVRDVRGAFNLAAEPILDAPVLARLLRARPLPINHTLMRAAVALAWHLRLTPASPGWLDMAFGSPLMDTGRARGELGWTPARSGADALLEALRGIADNAGFNVPPLASRTVEPAGS